MGVDQDSDKEDVKFRLQEGTGVTGPSSPIKGANK